MQNTPGKSTNDCKTFQSIRACLSENLEISILLALAWLPIDRFMHEGNSYGESVEAVIQEKQIPGDACKLMRLCSCLHLYSYLHN